mgnify:FL=1
MYNIILFNPQIPPNTGNIIRLCANTGSKLHLIKPLGFEIDEKSYRRAGLDYHNHSILTLYDDLNTCIKKLNSKNIYAISKFGKIAYNDNKFNEGDAILFGSETKGLPKDTLNGFQDKNKLFIPMIKNSRSLNLSNAVSIVLYEAWKQNNFINSEPFNGK